jgi:hypothetical protein
VDDSGYHPQTKGGQRVVHDRIAKDIICHLFAGEPDSELNELAAACERLENSMIRMHELESDMVGCKESKGAGVSGSDVQTKENNDSRFDHSWVLGGPDPGWY